MFVSVSQVFKPGETFWVGLPHYFRVHQSNHHLANVDVIRLPPSQNFVSVYNVSPWGHLFHMLYMFQMIRPINRGRICFNRPNKIIAADPYEEKSSGCIYSREETHQRDYAQPSVSHNIAVKYDLAILG